MREINFITYADKNYFPYVNLSVKQLVKFYPNCKFYIYDWGFTPSQRKILESSPITILIDWYNKIDWENGYKKIPEEFEIGYNWPKNDLSWRHKEYLWSQVPFCILDCSKRIRENLFVIDGDAFLINKIDEVLEDDFDIGVTLRPKKIFEKIRKMGFEAELNIAVIFFKIDSKRIQIFIEEWIKEMELFKRGFVSQSSFIMLIKKRNQEILTKYYNEGIIRISNVDFKIKTFPVVIYGLSKFNKGYDDKKVKILHIKGILREKILQTIKQIKFYLYITKVLKIFPNFIRTRITKIVKLNELAFFLINSNKIKRIKTKLFSEFGFKLLIIKIKNIIKY